MAMSYEDKVKAINTFYDDQQLASQVESLRELGRKLGQEKHYEKQIEKVKKRFGQ